MSSPFIKQERFSPIAWNQDRKDRQPQYTGQEEQTSHEYTPYYQPSHYIQHTQSEGLLVQGQDFQHPMQQVRDGFLNLKLQNQAIQPSHGGYPIQRGNGENLSGQFGNTSSFSSMNPYLQHQSSHMPLEGGYPMQRGNGENSSGTLGSSNNSSSHLFHEMSHEHSPGGFSYTFGDNSATPTNNRQPSIFNTAFNNSNHGNGYGQPRHLAASTDQNATPCNGPNPSQGYQSSQHESPAQVYHIDNLIDLISSHGFRYEQRQFPSDELRRLYDAAREAWILQTFNHQRSDKLPKRREQNPMSLEFMSTPQHQTLCQEHAYPAPPPSEGYHPSVQQRTPQPGLQPHSEPQQVWTDPVSFSSSRIQPEFSFPSALPLPFPPSTPLSEHTRPGLGQGTSIYLTATTRAIQAAQGTLQPLLLQMPKPNRAQPVWEAKIDSIDRKADLGIPEPPECDDCDEELQKATRIMHEWYGWSGRLPSIYSERDVQHARNVARQTEKEKQEHLLRQRAQQSINAENAVSTGETLLNRVTRASLDLRVLEASTTLVGFGNSEMVANANNNAHHNSNGAS